MVERLDMNQERKQIKIFQDQDYKKLGILYGLFFEDLNHAAGRRPVCGDGAEPLV